MIDPSEVPRWLTETARVGYDGVTGFAWDFKEYMDAPGRLSELLEEHSLDLAAIDSHLHENEADYRACFEFMTALNCRTFVCIDREGPSDDYPRYGRKLNWVGEIAREYGIDVHYHNHTASVGETLSDMDALLAEIDPLVVKVMLDLGHATKDFVELPPRERAIAFLEKYWDRVNYMEFKDWNEKTDLNTPLGEGYVDWERVFGLLKSKEYSGWITVEQNGNDGLSLGRQPMECARVSRDFIRRGLGV